MLHSICQEIWKTQQWPQDWKRSVFISISKKNNAKECSNYHTVALISHASKVILKILQDRLQQYINWELPDVQVGFRIGRGNQKSNCQYLLAYRKNKEFQKTTTSDSLSTLKPLTVGSPKTVKNSSRDGNIRPPYLPPEKLVCRSRSNSYNRTWNNGLVGSPCSPRDFQESFPTPQFKSINSSTLSFLYSPTLISTHDYWKKP